MGAKKKGTSANVRGCGSEERPTDDSISGANNWLAYQYKAMHHGGAATRSARNVW